MSNGIRLRIRTCGFCQRDVFINKYGYIYPHNQPNGVHCPGTYTHGDLQTVVDTPRNADVSPQSKPRQLRKR